MTIFEKDTFGSFLKGAASGLDLNPKIDLPEIFTRNSTDLLASKFYSNQSEISPFEQDWYNIGKDFEKAISKYERSNSEAEILKK